jgi:starch synthase
LGYQGIYPWEKFDLLGWDENIMTTDAIEYYGKVNLMKAGLLCADKINTVSPNYRDETLRGGATGAGLEWILRQRQSDYYGILNGIDYEEWSPAEDRFISYRLDGGWNRFKLTNKKALFKACRFDERELFKPVLAIITRFAHQKGVDVLLQAVKGLVERGCKFVALGYGEKDLEALLYIFAKDYPTSVFSDFSHNEALAHQIYAGADMFVMPSRYEPCGLTQMIAMRYGTIPIVADVGGLKDSVTDFDSVTGEGTGFKINHHSAENILQTVDKALTAYGDRILWGELVERVAEVDFSWGKSAERYIELYKGIQCSRRS